jgi:energy-coupling factor transport system permease protein
VVVPLFLSSFRKANDLAFAMDARCYQGGDGRTNLHPLAFKPYDGAVLTAVVVFCAAALWMDAALHPVRWSFMR